MPQQIARQWIAWDQFPLVRHAILERELPTGVPISVPAPGSGLSTVFSRVPAMGRSLLAIGWTRLDMPTAMVTGATLFGRTHGGGAAG